MEYHHLPSLFWELFDAIYTDSFVKIAVNKDWTEDLRVSKGVLQGDPCSLLLFNLCFNTLMRILKEKRLKNLGYIWGPEGHSNECAWLQFADNAVLISTSTNDALTFIDIFVVWCSWSKMEIRLDKCCTYGAGKRDGMYAQYEFQLFINSEAVPSIRKGDSFIYLGKIFDFNMNKEKAKSDVCSKLKFSLETTSTLNIKAQLKLKILRQYIYTQVSYELKTYSFGEAWIDQNLDSLIANHVRSWLGMPVSTCVREMMTLPRNKRGLGIPSILHISKKLILGKRFTLKNSAHGEIRQMWSDTSSTNIEPDSILCNTPKKSEAMRALENVLTEQAETHVHLLVLQGLAARGISGIISKSGMERWSKLVESLPEYLFRFVRKAFSQQLATAANLVRWNRRTDPNCNICRKSIPQTNKHLLSNCSSLLERYTSRHNAILEKLVQWIDTHKSASQCLLVDLPSSRLNPIECVFQSSVHPDIVIQESARVLVLELTACHESNLLKSKEYKEHKYRDISTHLHVALPRSCPGTRIHYGSLGFWNRFEHEAFHASGQAAGLWSVTALGHLQVDNHKLIWNLQIKKRWTTTRICIIIKWSFNPVPVYH